MLEPNLSLPVAAFRPNRVELGAAQASSQASHAKTMPDLRQTLEGVIPTSASDQGKRLGQRAYATIFHQALGPSTEITENVLMARALLSPTYIHDSAATRMARVSTMPNRVMPHFGGAVDVWA